MTIMNITVPSNDPPVRKGDLVTWSVSMEATYVNPARVERTVRWRVGTVTKVSKGLVAEAKDQDGRTYKFPAGKYHHRLTASAQVIDVQAFVASLDPLLTFPTSDAVREAARLYLLRSEQPIT